MGYLGGFAVTFKKLFHKTPSGAVVTTEYNAGRGGKRDDRRENGGAGARADRAMHGRPWSWRRFPGCALRTQEMRVRPDESRGREHVPSRARSPASITSRAHGGAGGS